MIQARNMTFEAIIAKSMWGLGQPHEELKWWFAQDIAGEVHLG